VQRQKRVAHAESCRLRFASLDGYCSLEEGRKTFLRWQMPLEDRLDSSALGPRPLRPYFDEEPVDSSSQETGSLDEVATRFRSGSLLSQHRFFLRYLTVELPGCPGDLPRTSSREAGDDVQCHARQGDSTSLQDFLPGDPIEIYVCTSTLSNFSNLRRIARATTFWMFLNSTKLSFSFPMLLVPMS
jgi:hypothetical protein